MNAKGDEMLKKNFYNLCKTVGRMLPTTRIDTNNTEMYWEIN